MNDTPKPQLFNSSSDLNELFTAFAKFTGEVPNLLKSDTVRVQTKSGSSYNFRYVTLDDAIETVKPYLTKHGLSVMQLLTGKSVITILAHSSGQWIGTETAFGSALRDTMNSQEIGGVTTYVKRYAYISILGLSADEDDDSNSANGNTVSHTGTGAPKQLTPVPKTEPKPLSEPDWFTENGELNEKGIMAAKSIMDGMKWETIEKHYLIDKGTKKAVEDYISTIKASDI